MGKLDYRVAYNNRKFWKTVDLSNNNKPVSNNEELAENFNKHFIKIVENLNIYKILANNIASSDITDFIFNAIEKYEYYPSIKKLKHFMGVKDLKFTSFLKQKIRF